MRFVTKNIHAYLDYPVAISLMGLPFLLGLGASNPLALKISPVVGLAAFLLTVFDDFLRLLTYRFGSGSLFQNALFLFDLCIDSAVYLLKIKVDVVAFGFQYLFQSTL